MSFALVLNSSNVIGSQNSQFKYNFLGGNFVAKDMEMCIGNLTIPYSFFNVSTFYNNQTFSFTFPTGATTTTLSIFLTAGFYTVTDINQFCQNSMIAAGLYLKNASDEYVYYFDISYNVTYYAIQFVASIVPTALPSGFAFATSGFYSTLGGLPTTSNQVPQLILPSNGPLAILGFTAATYPPTQLGAAYSITSNALPPVGSTINSLIFRCNLVKNVCTTPADILDAANINSTFGSNITYAPNFEKWLPLSDGTFSNLIFTFVDQNLNSISANDPNVSITLLIRKIKSGSK